MAPAALRSTFPEAEDELSVDGAAFPVAETGIEAALLEPDSDVEEELVHPESTPKEQPNRPPATKRYREYIIKRLFSLPSG